MHLQLSGNVDDISINPAAGRSVVFAVPADSPADCGSAVDLTLRSAEGWAARLERSITIGRGKTQRIEDLAPARYAVSAVDRSKNCFYTGPSTLDLTATGTTRTFPVTFLAGGAIHGRVSGENRSAQRVIVALLSSDAFIGSDPVQVVETAPGADFRFEALRPGKYFIAAHPASGDSNERWFQDRSAMRQVEVHSATATDIELSARAQAKN
jgi:hypothetical protein